MSFLVVFIFCLLSFFYFSSFGAFCNRFFYKIDKFDNVLEYCLLGVFSLSFIGLFANFFISLNTYFNSLIFIFSIIYFFFLEKNLKLKILKYSIIISLISFLTIIFDYTNRPDSGLYHLPYTGLLNEEKLIIGSANLNERFGIISILQYLSAINNNFIFDENGILIPLVIIYSSTLLFFFNIFFNNKQNDNLRVLCFLFIIFILTNLNRYSGFGNDGPAHFYYFILTYYYLEYSNTNFADKGFKLITIISIYIFLIKPFFILLFILPLIFIFNNYKNIKILSSINFFALFIISLWLIKNFLVTGCLLYPLDFTCIQKFDWTLDPSLMAIESEAWTKGWPDTIDKSINYEEYVKNFYWIDTWINNHMKIIFKKLSPFIIILVILMVVVLIKNSKNKLNHEKKYIELLIFNLIAIFIWFLLYPNYRFGLSLYGSFFSLFFIIFFFNRLSLKNIFFYNCTIFFVFFLSFVITLKNIDRIYNNYSTFYIDYPWPKKNSHYATNQKLTNEPIEYNGEAIYYITPKGELCFYSKSPCTHKKNLKIKNEIVFNFYKKYTIDD